MKNHPEFFNQIVALDAAYAKIESLTEEKREMQKRISELEIRDKERENGSCTPKKLVIRQTYWKKNYHAL